MAGKWGGKQPGAGRPKGSKNANTIERDAALAQYKERVAKLTDSLMDKQLALAKGCSYLYRIDKDEKGKRQKPELVTDEKEIRAYLEGGYDSETYYFITAEKPDLRAIQDMLDRTYGRAAQSMDVTSGGEKLEILSLLSEVNGQSKSIPRAEGEVREPGVEVK